MLRATRYGKVIQTSTAAANDDEIPGKVIFDLNLSYAVTDHLKLTVGANNLFNIYPPVLKPANRDLTTYTNAAQLAAVAAAGLQGVTLNGATGYPTNTGYYNAYSPYGVSGGFYYARVNVSF